ncbi:unnamed protein product (mitochondrion) [Plasmodiophora brassicae]|uniref:Uncharacterized protein n=1 Tax=Plasmodiophora brassicae TaxID=37360 RepID=A0A0G4IUK1_PLABS|nr:hypothetical protein PBRA_007064 [Plasmodiophora brassicae]SPQ95723.1 unnamed protein product [Plasmodiophora brassicae]
MMARGTGSRVYSCRASLSASICCPTDIWVTVTGDGSLFASRGVRRDMPATPTERIVYSKAELRALSLAPAANVKPADLLHVVDRVRVRPHHAQEDSHATKSSRSRTRAASHISGSSGSGARWSKHDGVRHSSSSSVTLSSRHWDSQQRDRPAERTTSDRRAGNHHGLRDDDDAEAPEWADGTVNFTENFDFSQAMLDRDRPAVAAPAPTVEPTPPPVPTSTRSRFAFATGVEEEQQRQEQAPTPSTSPTQALGKDDSTPPARSRFKFVMDSSPEKPAAAAAEQQPVAPHTEARSRFGFVLDNSPEVQRRPSPPAPPSVDIGRPYAQPDASDASHPKGTPIEVNAMFQMFATMSTASNLPPPPVPPPARYPPMHYVPPPPHFPMPTRAMPPPPLAAYAPVPVAAASASSPTAAQPAIAPVAQARTTRRGVPLANVPARTAPPAYVRSYMQLTDQPVSGAVQGGYAPPGLIVHPGRAAPPLAPFPTQAPRYPPQPQGGMIPFRQTGAPL